MSGEWERLVHTQRALLDIVGMVRQFDTPGDPGRVRAFVGDVESVAQRGLSGPDDDQQYLIWSHHHKTWWGPGGRGYRRDILNAGRYDLADIERWLGRGCGCCEVPEVVIPVPPAAVFASPGRTAVWVAREVKRATEVCIAAGRTNRWAGEQS